MRKSLIGLTSAITIAATAATVPTPASAYPGWVIPAIVAAGAGGVALGAGITSAHAQSTGSIFPTSTGAPGQPQIGYDPNTMVQPGCHLARERIRGEWRRVEVCP